MKKDKTPIAVTSRSFSQNQTLRKELLDKYENVSFNDNGKSLKGNDLITFLKGREKAITALEVFTEEIFAALPELKVISKYGVGLDMIDLNAMERRGIGLGWKGGVNKRSVAELFLAFVLSLLHKVPESNDKIIENIWKQIKGKQLTGKTVGIIGCGNVGKEVAMMVKAFDCKILANDIVDYADFYKKYNIKPVGLEELLKSSDIVTLHVPLDESTKNILNAERLSLMKQGSILINTARGGLVDEQKLKKLLLEGKIYGAAFDVFAVEPPSDKELLEFPNFIATSHIGASTEEAILAMGRAAIEGLDNARLPSKFEFWKGAGK